ncbi:hypothetical protein J6590_042512 [Homalodisca vitripennis]|nr:hypothetical protein J6590_042512 [Homalodisca vitripennis]
MYQAVISLAESEIGERLVVGLEMCALCWDAPVTDELLYQKRYCSKKSETIQHNQIAKVTLDRLRPTVNGKRNLPEEVSQDPRHTDLLLASTTATARRGTGRTITGRMMLYGQPINVVCPAGESDVDARPRYHQTTNVMVALHNCKYSVAGGPKIIIRHELAGHGGGGHETIPVRSDRVDVDVNPTFGTACVGSDRGLNLSDTFGPP